MNLCVTREAVRDELSEVHGDWRDVLSNIREGHRDGLRKIREVRGDGFGEKPPTRKTRK